MSRRHYGGELEENVTPVQISVENVLLLVLEQRTLNNDKQQKIQHNCRCQTEYIIAPTSSDQKLATYPNAMNNALWLTGGARGEQND